MDKENLKKISALLVHVARVDEIYSEKERGIIKNPPSYIEFFNLRPKISA
jgi:hypothetical protein